MGRVYAQRPVVKSQQLVQRALPVPGHGGGLATLGIGICCWPPQYPAPLQLCPHPGSPVVVQARVLIVPGQAPACSRLADTPPTQDLGFPGTGQLSKSPPSPAPKVLPPSFHTCSAATLGVEAPGNCSEGRSCQRTERHHVLCTLGKRSTNGLCSACQTLHMAS